MLTQEFSVTNVKPLYFTALYLAIVQICFALIFTISNASNSTAVTAFDLTKIVSFSPLCTVYCVNKTQRLLPESQ